MGILIEDKQIVVPGEEVAEGMDFLPAPGTFRDGDKIVACQLGLVNISGRLIKVIPLEGAYMPKRGDVVIGKINDLTYSNWFVDIGYAYEAALSMKEATTEFIERGAELTDYYTYDDVIVAKITNVTKSKSIDLSMIGPGLRKLQGGRLLEISAQKVPRVVGKQGSMISMIKEITNCQIIVGQNGRVWISGTEIWQERLASEAVLLIARKAHTHGLTDRVKAFLESGSKK
ncbi:RNA-binding protein [Candidatus Woesearchaeota archaeon]|nr:RNA-binding protein [Candidatus Woesearchaeota archaeon]